MKILVQGKTQGIVLKSNDPINKNHDLFEKSIKDSILVFPSGVGSSVGAYTIYSIKSNNSAPLAMICQKADLTVATGCALANIPLVMVSDEEFSLFQSGQKISLDTKLSNPIVFLEN
jgi:predicted aconitase with swiveling domain